MLGSTLSFPLPVWKVFAGFRRTVSIRKHYFADVEFYIQGATFFERPDFRPNLIACLNGILNVSTGDLNPFSPDEWILVQIPQTHNRDADNPKIKQFLTQVVGTNQLSLLQEWFGYHLLQAFPYDKAAMYIGEGENGKSTVISLQTRFLGSKNCSAIALQQLNDNRFAASRLYGKLANMYPDLSDKAVKSGGNFKTTTGGDRLTAEFKFKDPFEFEPIVKQTYSANSVPETKDDTHAFFRRWLLIMFPNKFTGKDRDPMILEKITTPDELSGLLNWALQGLHRLIDQGDFSTNETTEQVRSRYIKMSNSCKAYIEERLEESIDSKDFIPEDELYKAYLEYCATEKILSKPKRDLTINIHQHLPNAKQTNERVNNKVTHVWQFVKYVGLVATVATPTPKSNYTEEFPFSKGRIDEPATVATDPPSISRPDVTAVTLSDLVEVHQTKEPFAEHECGICGYPKPTVWEGRSNKGNVIPLCDDCVRDFHRAREVS